MDKKNDCKIDLYEKQKTLSLVSGLHALVCGLTELP
jgi:hypothetical protein